jgi:hypothetical protein
MMCIRTRRGFRKIEITIFRLAPAFMRIRLSGGQYDDSRRAFYHSLEDQYRE